MNKTNVMRTLDQMKIAHNEYSYDVPKDGPAPSGLDVANALGFDPDKVFKTLVTQAASKNYYVYMIPVAAELDLKKAAKAAQEKSIAMIKSKDLLGLTGYIHGGCSPVGMKKQFTTFVDETAELFDTIVFSAGKVGYQVELSLEDLKKVCPLTTWDLTV